MTFFNAVATVVNSDISSTRILDASKSEIDSLEDMAIQLGYARSEKEQYDQAVKDARNPIYCASDQALFLEIAHDHRKAYEAAQGKLAELAGKIGVRA